MYTLSHTHRWRGERCGALSVLGKERARARHMHKTNRTATRKLLALPAGPQPGHGATLRTSHVSRERANWHPRKRLGIPKERLRVRESGWAFG